MLSTDLTLDPSTSISAGTSSPTIYSLLGGNTSKESIRSAAAVALTNPETFRIGHTQRVIKGLKTTSNSSVSAGDIIMDRHLNRLDINVPQTKAADPEFKVNFSIQLVIEVPRLGSETPTATQIMDGIKSMVSMLDASTQANLKRLLNGET